MSGPGQVPRPGRDTPRDELEEKMLAVTERALDEARRQGATAAEAAISQGQGLSVTVRHGEVETVEHNRDKSLDVTVWFGYRSGSASTTDFSPRAVADSVDAACTIARYTEEDPFSGLADPERLAREFPDLDLDHPWNPGMEQAIELAQRCEQAALEFDARITNSEGATLHSHDGRGLYTNSLGFAGFSRGSRHSLSCSVIGGEGDGMQRDYWYDSARDHEDLLSPEEVGRIAAERTVRRLGARRLQSVRLPVVFEAPVAASLLSHLVSAISGGNLYRKASFLVDHLGRRIFPDGVRIHEQPRLRKGPGSAVFDREGVETRDRDLVSEGVLRSYVLSSYPARKLGLETTGNAGGVHNLAIDPGERNLEGLLREMGKGVLVTELIGFGVNTVTGDYSRGAAGFLVEGGEVRHAVQEFTIAGNLKEMFMDLVEVGSDVDRRGNIHSGSILLQEMAIAGQ